MGDVVENAQMTDEYSVELNPEPTPDPDLPEFRVGERPAEDADESEWVDYCVSLGADRNYLENETEHKNDMFQTEVHSPFDKEQLIELANSLGG